MAQYKNGTVSVTNGGNVVTGTGTAWSSNVVVGSLFLVDGEGTSYEVSAVDSDTQIQLSEAYGGSTKSGQVYAIARDFTPNFSIPYPAKGDIATATIFKRAVVKIESEILKKARNLSVAQSITTTAPPAAPTIGHMYVVPAGATGDWSGKDENQAVYQADGSWKFYTPQSGLRVSVADEDYADYVYDGAWELNKGGAAAADAQGWAVTAVDVLFTDSSGTSGYSSLHHSTKAAGSATAASTSETNAVSSATAASTSETSAAASESAAATSETNAAASETAAATSATNAATSETNASNSASAAATSETNAGTSETNAAASEAAAATSETNAAGSATTATNEADYAEEWATKAENSLISVAAGGNGTTDYSALHHASKADSSASAASTSESNAATSETNAANSATAAATSETNADTSETNAANSASAASTSETNAASSASAASTSETNAASSATAAATSETNAATSETNAAASETAAATSETNAAGSATTATNEADYAEEWATKAENSLISVTAGGDGITDYSALHHASKADSSATAAATSEGNAATSETNASNSAIAAATSETNAGTSETAAANSASAAATSESAAATSASNASTSETNAANSESDAEDWANHPVGTLVPAGDGIDDYSALHHATKASESETAAATSETNAAASETAAATSETNAANSATAASTSENNAAASEADAEDWANHPVDTLVPGGDGVDDYSALHHATKAADSESAAATSETNAANSASAAATSESNAVTSETNAASSASAASTSETNAAASESAASTSETNAANSASSAATSEANAEAALTDFESRYLGAYANDPTTNNEGGPLSAGILYWNTIDNEMRAYDGSTWIVTYNPSISGVDTFNARSGAVTPQAGDYSANQITVDDTNLSITATETQAAIAALDSKPAGAANTIDGVSNPGGNIDLVGSGDITITADDTANTITFSVSAPVDSVNGQTGAISLTASDVGASATGHSHANATTTVDGFMAAGDKTKLDGVASGAEVNPSDTDGLAEGITNLYYTTARASADAPVQSVNGATGAVTVSIPVDSVNGYTGVVSLTAADVGASATGHGHGNATTTAAGFMAAADKSKLNGIEAGATADQTASEIKTAYESNADTNAFTDSQQTKLTGIESGAQVNPASTDALSEGATNLYYTDVRVNGRIDTRVDKAFVDALNVDADTLDGLNASAFALSGHGHGNATTTVDGFMASTDKTKLNGIEASATAGTVNVSANDTTPDSLKAKLVSGSNITITEQNDGGNETLQIEATSSGATKGFAIAMSLIF